jgi:hypothetical protein
MGVYSKGWMEMLIAGGMSYHSARKLTGKLSKIITECRSDIAKERNERAWSVHVEKQKEDTAWPITTWSQEADNPTNAARN